MTLRICRIGVCFDLFAVPKLVAIGINRDGIGEVNVNFLTICQPVKIAIYSLRISFILLCFFLVGNAIAV